MSATVTAPAARSIPLPVGRLVGVGAVIFFANAALLVLQLVAGKFLAPFVGSSLETWTSVIGVFLAGIALGNAFGGRLADRYPTPRTLAVLLAVGAVAALWVLAFPLVLAESELHKALPLAARIPVLAAVLCLPAGFVLSLLTPLAIKLGLPDVSHTGRVAGLIFALSTLGCLVGNYVTGFALIPAFPIDALVGAAAGVLAVLSGLTLVVLKAGTAEELTAAAPGGGLPRTGAGVGSAPNPHAFTDIRYAYLVVFLASFCGMTLELTASRVLALQLGVSLFTWTGIIGVMLAGTALGNFAGGQLADRPRRAVAGLGGVAVAAALVGTGMAVASAFEYPVLELLGAPRGVAQAEDLFQARLASLRIAVAFVGMSSLMVGVVVYRVLRALPDLNALSPRTALAGTLCVAALGTVLVFVSLAVVSQLGLFYAWDPIAQVMGWTFGLFFFPMFALGLVSPQVIRLAVPDVSHAGRVAGRVYAWSTVGAIAGTFATGYLLLSTVGWRGTVLCAALVLVSSSLVVAKVWDNNPLLYLFSVVLGGITGGFILSGRDREAYVVAVVESNYYTIKVGEDRAHGEPTGRLNLYLDHLLHSTVDPTDPTYLQYTHEYVQVECVRVARAAVAEPNVLVIGGGGYTFPRYLNDQIPEAHVDVVEIDPKVTWVAHEYLELKRHPHLNTIHMDGRQYVSERAARGSYDLVVQDAVNDLSVPGHLMTREYNDAVKGALKPDGVYLLTIIDSVAYGKLWKAGMATLAKSFAHVELLVPDSGGGGDWFAHRHVLVIYASDRAFSRDAIRDAMAEQVPPADPKPLQAALAVGSVEVPGSGPAFAARVGFATADLRPVPPVVRTTVVEPERLKPFTDGAPGVVLTDQFCPVDNLMPEVYRKRN
jgi:hypothetical protein